MVDRIPSLLLIHGKWYVLSEFVKTLNYAIGFRMINSGVMKVNSEKAGKRGL